MKKLNILLAFMLISSLSITAQKAKKDYEYKNTKTAEKLFNETKYQEAIVLFEKAYSKAKNTKEKGFITYHIAVSNQYIANNKEAKKYYERALRLKYDKYQEDIYRRIAIGCYEFPANVSMAGRQLIAGLLEQDLSKRLGCLSGGAEDIKNNPWFQGVDWKIVL
jgi:tetratricopeptide (TPR) repeat protein